MYFLIKLETNIVLSNYPYSAGQIEGYFVYLRYKNNATRFINLLFCKNGASLLNAFDVKSYFWTVLHFIDFAMTFLIVSYIPMLLECCRLQKYKIQKFIFQVQIFQNLSGWLPDYKHTVYIWEIISSTATSSLFSYFLFSPKLLQVRGENDTYIK